MIKAISRDRNQYMDEYSQVEKEKEVVLQENVRITGMGKSNIKIATLRYPVTITHSLNQELKDLIAKVFHQQITT